MSDVVLVAVITAVAGALGGIVGAIASPIGKDWVSRREFERTSEREDAVHRRDVSRAAAERELRVAREHRRAVSETLQAMSDAMRHYEVKWRGQDNYQAVQKALEASAAAWTTSRGIIDLESRELVGAWRQAFDAADMAYRNGQEPPGRLGLQRLYGDAAEHLGEILRALDKAEPREPMLPRPDD